MKDLIKNIAEANGWGFTYGRADFHNLYDGYDDGGIILFLDPLSSDEQIGERGNTEAVNWSGSLLLCMSSNLNEQDYETRYETYIGPLTSGAWDTLKMALRCEANYSLISARTTEVINSMDFNVDGLSVSFVIRELR